MANNWNEAEKSSSITVENQQSIERLNWNYMFKKKDEKTQ